MREQNKNLKPFKKGEERASTCGRRGQRVAVERYREQKSLRYWISVAKGVEITNKRTGETLPKVAVAAIQLVDKAAQGDLKAIELLAKMTGEMTERLELSSVPKLDIEIIGGED